jgi:hypothetical protein
LKIKEVKIGPSLAFPVSCELIRGSAEEPENKRFVRAEKHEFARMRANNSNGFLAFMNKVNRSV